MGLKENLRNEIQLKGPWRQRETPRAERKKKGMGNLDWFMSKDTNTKLNPVLQFFLWNLPTLCVWRLTVYYPSRQLRSTLDTKTFRIPLTKTKTFGERASFFFSQARNNGTHCLMMSITHHPYFLLRKHWKLIFSNLHMRRHTPLPHECVCARVSACVCACLCVCVHIYLCVYVSVCACMLFFFLQWMYLYAWKWTSVIHRVLVNVRSQYAYLMTCLCTLVPLVVPGLSTSPAVVDCMIVHSVVVMVCFVFCF